MRFFIQFSYDGKTYHGWQRQPNAHTVQEEMENCMSTLLRKDIELVGAGRTDAGVHAKVMMAHFDLDARLPNDFMHRMNSFLPETIAVQDIYRVKPEAHARFDALERTYEYWVIQEKNPFLYDFAHRVIAPLDLKAMNQAALYLMEYKDFKCFSRSNTDVKTYLCDIRKAEWTSKNGKLIFTISADRFLRNMVRAVVGTLLEVGLGKSSPEDVKKVIKSRDRSEAGVSVPAKGLYLTEIKYPDALKERG